jgi:hypothetical protein
MAEQVGRLASEPKLRYAPRWMLDPVTWREAEATLARQAHSNLGT